MGSEIVTEAQQLRKAAIWIGYLAWFLVLVRIVFMSTGNPYTSTAEVLGSHAGLAFWLLVLSVIPYFMARNRAKKSGSKVSWPYVMTGVTLIALLLAIGGFYGQLHTPKNVPVSTEAGPWTQYQQPQTQASQSHPDPEALPYERRAWSGNTFDQFDSVQAIETKARSIPPLNEQRAWAAVIAWQAYFMGSGGKQSNVALYMGVDSVLEGLKSNRGICRPGEIVTVSAAQASPDIPAGSQFVTDDCDRSP